MSGRSTGRVAALIATQRQAQRRRLRLAAAAGAVVSVAAVGLLGLSGWFITGAAFAGATGGLAVQSFNYLTPSAIIRLLAILRTGARYVERVAGHEAALKALARLRPQLFQALASAPPERALALSSGDASARLVQDVDAVQTLFVRLSAPCIRTARRPRPRTGWTTFCPMKRRVSAPRRATKRCAWTRWRRTCRPLCDWGCSAHRARARPPWSNG